MVCITEWIQSFCDSCKDVSEETEANAGAPAHYSSELGVEG